RRDAETLVAKMRELIAAEVKIRIEAETKQKVEEEQKQAEARARQQAEAKRKEEQKQDTATVARVAGWWPVSALAAAAIVMSLIGFGGYTFVQQAAEPPGQSVAEADARMAAAKMLGFDLAPLTDELRKKNNIRDDVKGVLVTGVGRNSNDQSLVGKVI